MTIITSTLAHYLNADPELEARLVDVATGDSVIDWTTTGVAQTSAPDEGPPWLYTATFDSTSLPVGVYLAQWRRASAPGVVWVDDDEITLTVAPPTGGNLCTLDDVRERRGTAVDQHDQDDLVERVIASVSAAIAREYKREFLPTAGLARTFRLRSDNWDRLLLYPYEVRTVSLVRVNPDHAEPTELGDGDYRLEPIPAEDGTYHRLRLKPGAAVAAADAWHSDVIVEVTGDWGIAVVPPDVREAAIVTVVHNMRTTVGQYAIADGAGGETRYERVEIPQAARDLLEPFRRHAIHF